MDKKKNKGKNGKVAAQREIQEEDKMTWDQKKNCDKEVLGKRKYEKTGNPPKYIKKVVGGR